MSVLEIKPDDQCRYDMIALGEIMLRRDPGDGRVRTAEIADRARATNDRFFRSMAESAVRAMLNPRCQPLKLSAEKYHQWRNMTLTFYPGEMF